MATRVGINGFGRIGRNFYRAHLARGREHEEAHQLRWDRAEAGVVSRHAERDAGRDGSRPERQESERSPGERAKGGGPRLLGRRALGVTHGASSRLVMLEPARSCHRHRRRNRRRAAAGTDP